MSYHHPENTPRPYGSYDPAEPLVIPYADLLAAINATTVLTKILEDNRSSLDEYHVQNAQHHLAYAVAPDQSLADSHLPSQEAAAEYVRALRDRLRRHLPRPNPGVQQ